MNTLIFLAQTLPVTYVNPASTPMIEWVKVGATLLAAGVAAFIAWRIGHAQVAIGKRQADIAATQAETAKLMAENAKHKLKLDLFDRRYKIYEATKEYLEAVMYSHEEHQTETYIKFRDAATTARLLFPIDLKAKLDVIKESGHMNRINVGRASMAAQREAEGKATDLDRSHLSQTAKLKNDFEDKMAGIYRELEDDFAPYIGFENI